MVITLEIEPRSIYTKLRRQCSNVSLQFVEAIVGRWWVVCETGLPSLRTIAEIVTDCNRGWSALRECEISESAEEK